MQQKIGRFLNFLFKQKDLSVILFMMTIVSIIIIPLPSNILDILLTTSISLSILILLISLYVPKPTDLTTFPTLILIITLFRLALNIATTRMILSHGNEGADAVSSIISSFGNFVVGGNFVIGSIIFLILVIINYMVITKGSTRVAEVAARFTLDSMPGKQMAVDAELNAGLIDNDKAKQRRSSILQEANFYGAMDGSSKFVKGDAVAGIVITIINIIGGFLIGIFQHGMSMADSAQTFTLLTIGDGLVSQIPALIVSTATGIMITRSSEDSDNFAEGSINQIMGNAKVLIMVGFIMLLFAIVPGLPTLSMGLIGLLFLTLGWSIYKYEKGELNIINTNERPKKTKTKKTDKELQKEEENILEDILKVEMLELVLGYELIPLTNDSKNSNLLNQIRSMRRKTASDFGFLIPKIRIKDDLNIQPQEYQIFLKGILIGKGTVIQDKLLAIDNGNITNKVDGEPTKEPTFGLDALWIAQDKREDAIANGYTVVNPSTVISTHISELIKRNAKDLITRQEVQNLIDKIQKDFPSIVDELLKVTNIGLVQRVFQALLHEKIPLKDILNILETITDTAEYTKNIEIITQQVRVKLSRTITQIYTDENNTLKLLTFDVNSEQMMLDKLQEQNGVKNLAMNANEINALVEATSAKAAQVLQKGISPVIVIVDPQLRKSIAEIFEKFSLDIVTLSHAEIDSNTTFEITGTIVIK